MISVYRLGVVGTTPASNMTSIQLPRKGVIKQVVMNGNVVIETDSSGMLQLAVNRPTVQTGSISTPTGILGEINLCSLLTTSGFTNCMQTAVINTNVPVSEKDTVYLHGATTTGFASGCDANCLIYVDEQ